jgi:hypothetical protein
MHQGTMDSPAIRLATRDNDGVKGLASRARVTFG